MTTKATNLMEAAGLRVLEAGAVKPEEESKSRALARPSRMAQMRRIVTSLYEICTLTDHSRKPRNWKLDRVRERVVMQPDDPNMPYLVWVTFAVKTDDKGRKLLQSDVHIPDPSDPRGKRRVLATPHILLDGAGGILPYVKAEIVKQKDESGVEQDAVRYYADSLLCIVLRPLETRSDGPVFHRVVPVGLAPPEMIATWNQIASEFRDRGAPEAEWPDITVMPNNLRTEDGQLFLLWKPRFLREGTRGGYMYGDIFGQIVLHFGSDDDLAQPDIVDEVPKFVSRYYFVVLLNERRIDVRCIGKEGVSLIRTGSLKFGDSYRMDGFKALGVDPITVDYNAVMSHAMHLAASAKLDLANPLYNYALSVGELNPMDTERNARGALRSIAETAAIMVRGELKLKLEEIVTKLSGIQGLPTLEDVLVGEDLESVWFRKSGDDVLGVWITSKMEANFSWTSWFQRNVRLELFRVILSKEGKVPPVKKLAAKAEEPKVEDTPVVPPTDTPTLVAVAIDEVPADATPPTTPRRRSRKVLDTAVPS